MARPSKDPEIRINEILEIAEPLFYNKGYHQTTIADIVSAIGVAPGTIYYYFKSKEAILDAIIGRQVSRFSEQIQLIAASPNLDSINKLQEIVRKLFSSIRHSDSRLLFEFLHTDDTLHILHRIELQSKLLLFEPLRTSIQQGMTDGSFHDGNSTVLTNIILALLYSLITATYNKLDPKIFATQLQLSEQLIQQALGSTKALIIYTN